MIDKQRLDHIIHLAGHHGRFFCKFLSPNDLGLKRSVHQEGIYIPNQAAPLFFSEAGVKGEIKDHWIEVLVEGEEPAIQSRAVWYGSKTRREYRLTRFWAHTSFDRSEQLGNLIVFIQASEELYLAFVLDKEEEIETFCQSFEISMVKNNAVVGINGFEEEGTTHSLEHAIRNFAESVAEFPSSVRLSEQARAYFYTHVKGIGRGILPDAALLKWIDLEFSIFREIERILYRPYLEEPFGELDRLIEFANQALNRRKSRAGRSLEHHVEYLLHEWKLPFSHPGQTEGNKKPDFLFPCTSKYKDFSYEGNKLVMLGVKTTCKDRWRQILNEADRIPIKHLLTLQQGISENQLEEMKQAGIKLVVPKALHNMYPETYRPELQTVQGFLQELQERYGKVDPCCVI